MARHRLISFCVALAAASSGLLAQDAAAGTNVIPPLVGGNTGSSPCQGGAYLMFSAGGTAGYRVHHLAQVSCVYPYTIETRCYSIVYDVLGQAISSASSEGTNGCAVDATSAGSYLPGSFFRQQFGFTLTLTAPNASWVGDENGFCTNGPPNVANCDDQQQTVAPIAQSYPFG